METTQKRIQLLAISPKDGVAYARYKNNGIYGIGPPSFELKAVKNWEVIELLLGNFFMEEELVDFKSSFGSWDELIKYLQELYDEKMFKIDAKTAQNIADAFLANEVGNLLMAGEPKLTQKSSPCWTMPILLGNARRGLLGEVGTLRVDANSGKVLFDPKEKEKVKSNAKTLFHRNTSSSTIP